MGKNQTIETDMRRPLYGGYNSAAEFVTPGHPDKTCDQIAGKILDAALKINSKAHVAIEMVACNGQVVIGGEVSPDVFDVFKKDDFKEVKTIAKSIFLGLGYDSKSPEFNVDVSVIINIQSVDIDKGDDTGGVGAQEESKAGDQGVMCGYAMYAPEREHMPAAFWYSQRLAMQLFKVSITDKTINNLFADGKTQVIIKEGKVSHVTIAIQHGKEWNENQEELKAEIEKHVIIPIIGHKVESITVNGTGKFAKGSIWADAAEVGRKIVVDQMGPDIPVGGGTLNGKDPSKVDFTAAVMARYVAKNIVANKLADEALVQFAFTIGQPDPDLIIIHAPGWKLDITPEEWCKKNFKTSAQGMINELNLQNPQGWTFENAAKFGYYGHTNFPWERVVNL
jgi:S-adenosylmethionine synthetase